LCCLVSAKTEVPELELLKNPGEEAAGRGGGGGGETEVEVTLDLRVTGLMKAGMETV